MSFDLGFCDECGKPATTAVHYGERAERYCEKHWIESRGGLVEQVVCADCEELVAQSEAPSDLQTSLSLSPAGPQVSRRVTGD